MSDHPHIPVMLAEVLEAAAPAPGEHVVDMTFGAGGYTRAFLERGADVTAFDRDPSAAPAAAALAAAFPGRFRLIAQRFSTLEEALAGRPAPDAIVFDVGVSSMQLDQAERGFSFMQDGPLDMRMSAEGPTAADVVNHEPVEELARIFRDYGEEKKARHIANVLVGRRAAEPFTRTLDLAAAVEKAVGGRRGAPIHPATRVFQGLRIAVNDELGELSRALLAAERILTEGGRLVVVSFHSLEDRIVKAFLAERAGRTPAGSRHLPQGPAVSAAPSFRLLRNGATAASAAEAAANPRARSAKLRAAIRTEAPPLEGRRMSWLGDIFNRRFKGFRVVELGAVACLAVLILGVYAFKAGAGRESAQIGEVEQRIAEEGHKVRLLKAELAHLETPERLTRISTDYLGLAPADAKREAPVDSLAEISKHLSVAPAAAPAVAVAR